jgi:hypothetical protein
MNRIIAAAACLVLATAFLATSEAQVTKSITVLAELQHVTSADHEVKKLKFTSLDKRYPFVNDIDFTLAEKAKFVYVDGDTKKTFTAKTVLTDATAKKLLKKGATISVQIGGTANNGAVVGSSGVREVRFGPSITKKE